MSTAADHLTGSVPHARSAVKAAAVAVCAGIALFAGACEDSRDPAEATTPESGADSVAADLNGVTFTATLAPSTLVVSERATLTLSVEAQAEADVRWPAVLDAGDFTVVAVIDLPPTVSPADPLRLITSRRFTLEPFLSGQHVIPPLSVNIAAAGETFEIHTGPLRATVTSLGEISPDSASVPDLLPPIEEHRSRPRWTIPAAVIAVATAAAGVALAVVLARRRSTAVPEPGAAARAQLNDLTSQRPPAEQLYARLAEILRTYLTHRGVIAATLLTTDEIRRSLPASTLPLPLRTALFALLERADMIKFARITPSLADEDTDLFTATRVIDAVEHANATGAGTADSRPSEQPTGAGA